MIKNFDELKKQLTELVDVVNGFKSEQVQLRVLEAVLSNLGSGPAGATHSTEAPSQPPRKAKKKKSSKAASLSGSEGAATKKATGKKTPKAAIVALIADGYFAQHRSIGTIVSHLAEKKATTLTQQAVQITLNRLVQNGEMERGKNADGQFEYWK